MGKTKKLHLTSEQRSELEKGLKFGSCHRYRMRCQGILLKADGMKGEEIAAIVGYGKIAVYNWVKRYEKDGISALKEKGSRGPKPLMASADIEKVKEAVRKRPREIPPPQLVELKCHQLQELVDLWSAGRICL